MNTLVKVGVFIAVGGLEIQSVGVIVFSVGVFRAIIQLLWLEDKDSDRFRNTHLLLGNYKPITLYNVRIKATLIIV